MKVEIGEIECLVIQQVGNKSKSEGIAFASYVSEADESAPLLRELVCNSFKFEEFKHLDYVGGVELNPVYRFTGAIFDNPEEIIKQANNIARILYEQSIHPNIKNGELYIILLKDCRVDGETTKAIAMLKSERKDRFLTVVNDGRAIKVKPSSGLNLKMVDKGCIVFNLRRDEGFVVSTVDRTNGVNDAHYWTDNFLHAVNREDDYHQTVRTMEMCSEFIQRVREDDEVMGARLAKATSQLFDEGASAPFSFEKMMDDLNLPNEKKNQFLEIKSQYETDFGDLPSDFILDSKAVKRKSISKMNVLKLGAEFEVKILSASAQLESGVDDLSGKRFLKLYY